MRIAQMAKNVNGGGGHANPLLVKMTIPLMRGYNKVK